MSSSDDNVLLAFMLVVGAGLSTGLGAAIVFSPRLIKLANKRFLASSLGFSCGVMLYVSFVEILQKSVLAFSDVPGLSGDQNTHHIHMHKGCCPVDASGEIDTWQALADKEIKTLEKRRARSNSADHNDSDDGNSNSNSNGAIIRKPETQLTLDIELGEDDSLDDGESAEDRNQKKLVRMGLNTALAIGIHNFPEGLATFVAALDDPSVGISLAVAIAIHNIPEGLCVAIPIYYATGSKKKAFWWAMLSGATEPIGALIGWGILQGSVGETAYGVLFGFVAGMMVMICLHELIPTAHRYDPEDRVVTNSAVCGMAVMAISLCLFVA
ncbi:hypothetical protein ScalyP_jg9048 [Parmales sp. scaly parma]|nr:hypothetical protein ScalyP_jg9048 [Parmales sp. scaly parma]